MAFSDGFLVLLLLGIGVLWLGHMRWIELAL
jgi:hypothetical protein